MPAAFVRGTPLHASHPPSLAAFRRFVAHPDAYCVPHAVAVMAWSADHHRAPAGGAPAGPRTAWAGAAISARVGACAPRYVITLEEALARAGRPVFPAAQQELAARLAAAAAAAGTTVHEDGGLAVSLAGVPIVVLGRRWPHLLKRALALSAPRAHAGSALPTTDDASSSSSAP